ncbi:class I SAM-dependent methyltransferase [Phytoactinopolyspora alkaliphila]|uniref:Class I SAM-dependent methyltransferase n=1 Tax=Phytoactinopolyspora alkaliphila TaxID=1783498 RepID=A0A6N9YMX4_9ACTN|nr:methyltransferase domain-containing protein [Phytoactinopolyspora alkaliphila]NED96396.1 class I SAM-dependent methyltransferase [Phytoactinopolyspora alkaliphila]
MESETTPAPPGERAYEHLVREAVAAPFEGWDFSWLTGRTAGEELTWDYSGLARAAIAGATRVLDIDTGDGALLADLGDLPDAIATEPHPPNVPIAKARLAPLGVEVRPGTGAALPVADGDVDLALNRHGMLHAEEIARVLRAGGTLLTQQVGSRNDTAFNDALGVPRPAGHDEHTLTTAVSALEAAGLVVEMAREEFPATRYLDIGAVVYQLTAVPWQVPGFDVERFDERLREIDATIRASGGFTVTSHRFLIRARRR